jgi:3-oxoacyl-[acyl-carrier protein] reductase
VFSAQGDVSCAKDAERMVSQAIDALGGLDFLINNAGTALTDTPIPNAQLDQLTEEFWSEILSTNLVAPFRCTKAAAGALRKSHGAVVNTASVGGLDMVGSSMAYGASKAGLINLTKNLARGLAPDVRVNAVAPGLVETAWTLSWPEERKRALIDRSILKRACTAQDVADVILFLCVSARMITGQTIVVDGGLSLAS